MMDEIVADKQQSAYRENYGGAKVNNKLEGSEDLRVVFLYVLGFVVDLRGIAIGIPPTIIAMMLSVACQLDSAQDRVRKSTLIYFRKCYEK